MKVHRYPTSVRLQVQIPGEGVINFVRTKAPDSFTIPLMKFDEKITFYFILMVNLVGIGLLDIGCSFISGS